MSGTFSLVLQYIKRVIRGKILHWADHHNPIANALFERVSLLRQDHQPIYKELLVVSYCVVKALTGMNRGRELPFAVDCRTISKEDFHRLYSILLAYFVFQLSVLNPAMREQLIDSLSALCGESQDQTQVLQRLQRIQALLPRAERRQPDVARLGEEVWQALKGILKPRDEPLDGVVFTTFAMGLFTDGLQKLQALPGSLGEGLPRNKV